MTDRETTGLSGWAKAAADFRALREIGMQHVPTRDMLAFADNRVDEEILFARHGHHIAECGSCQEGIALYRLERQRNLPTHAQPRLL